MYTDLSPKTLDVESITLNTKHSMFMTYKYFVHRFKNSTTQILGSIGQDTMKVDNRYINDAPYLEFVDARGVSRLS